MLEKHILNRFGSLLFRTGRGSACVLLVLALGCGREKITSYRVPKETNEIPAVAGGAASAPHLEWVLPSGWKEKPGDNMRLAAFEIAGPDGKSAEVTVVPLQGVSGIELDSVNMWREKLGLPAFSKDDLSKIETPADVGGAAAKLYDMSGESPAPGGKSKQRVTAAILPRNGTLWFFKLAGEDSLVTAQKEPFLGFLKSVSFHDAEPAPMLASKPMTTNPRKPPVDGASKPSWKLPPGWQEQAASAMVLASYSVPGENGAKADVSVSMFPGDVGGTLANVNRWRGQIGLPPVGPADLAAITTSVDLDGPKATVVDMTGKSPKTGLETRLLAAMVPRDGNTWFYKLMGDDKVVSREKTAFLEFIKTAH